MLTSKETLFVVGKRFAAYAQAKDTCALLLDVMYMLILSVRHFSTAGGHEECHVQQLPHTKNAGLIISVWHKIPRDTRMPVYRCSCYVLVRHM